MNHSRRSFGAVALVALIGLGASCSSSDDSPSTNATAPAATVATSAPSASTPAESSGAGEETTTSAAAGSGSNGAPAASTPDPVATVAVADSVIDVIASEPDLSNFAKLVASPDVQSVFTQARGITVFAPNDDELTDEVVQGLLDDANARTLFLGRHLLIGTTSFADLGASVTTANGDTYPVDQAAKTVGGLAVLRADEGASNGVVHVLAAPLPDTTAPATTTG